MRRAAVLMSLPRLTPYREYLALSRGRTARLRLRRGGRRWRVSRRARGLRRAMRARRESGAPEQIVLSLGAELSAALERAGAASCAVTLNTVLQAVFGVLLGRLTGRDDVVFGVTVAGRPAELAGVERMVGLFINTLPLRLRAAAAAAAARICCGRPRQRQSELMAHQHVGLAEIQQAAGLGELFDTLMVFENYPVDRAALAAEARRAAARPRSRAVTRRIIRWR